MSLLKHFMYRFLLLLLLLILCSFDGLTINDAVVYPAVCRRLHLTRVKAETWDVHVFL